MEKVWPSRFLLMVLFRFVIVVLLSDFILFTVSSGHKCSDLVPYILVQTLNQVRGKVGTCPALPRVRWSPDLASKAKAAIAGGCSNSNVGSYASNHQLTWFSYSNNNQFNCTFLLSRAIQNWTRLDYSYDFTRSNPTTRRACLGDLPCLQFFVLFNRNLPDIGCAVCDAPSGSAIFTNVFCFFPAQRIDSDPFEPTGPCTATPTPPYTPAPRPTSPSPTRPRPTRTPTLHVPVPVPTAPHPKSPRTSTPLPPPPQDPPPVVRVSRVSVLGSAAATCLATGADNTVDVQGGQLEAFRILPVRLSPTSGQYDSFLSRVVVCCVLLCAAEVVRVVFAWAASRMERVLESVRTNGSDASDPAPTRRVRVYTALLIVFSLVHPVVPNFLAGVFGLYGPVVVEAAMPLLVPVGPYAPNHPDNTASSAVGAAASRAVNVVLIVLAWVLVLGTVCVVVLLLCLLRRHIPPFVCFPKKARRSLQGWLASVGKANGAWAPGDGAPTRLLVWYKNVRPERWWMGPLLWVFPVTDSMIIGLPVSCRIVWPVYTVWVFGRVVLLWASWPFLLTGENPTNILAQGLLLAAAGLMTVSVNAQLTETEAEVLLGVVLGLGIGSAVVPWLFELVSLFNVARSSRGNPAAVLTRWFRASPPRAQITADDGRAVDLATARILGPDEKALWRNRASRAPPKALGGDWSVWGPPVPHSHSSDSDPESRDPVVVMERALKRAVAAGVLHADAAYSLWRGASPAVRWRFASLFPPELVGSFCHVAVSELARITEGCGVPGEGGGGGGAQEMAEVPGSAPPPSASAGPGAPSS